MIRYIKSNFDIAVNIALAITLFVMAFFRITAGDDVVGYTFVTWGLLALVHVDVSLIRKDIGSFVRLKPSRLTARNSPTDDRSIRNIAIDSEGKFK